MGHALRTVNGVESGAAGAVRVVENGVTCATRAHRDGTNMTILWRPSMAIGHPMIDADHRRLIDLINTAELALKGGAEDGALAAALDGLTDYAQEHFRREEDVMSLLGYDGLSQHREAHRMLRLRLREIRADIEASAGVASGREVDRLVELLRAWLLDHVLKVDMLLKPVVG